MMGLMEPLQQQPGKMALSAITSSSNTAASSELVSSSPPSSSAPRKKRNFDIAFLTGQSETSSEATATSITATDNSEKRNCLPEEGKDDLSEDSQEREEDGYQHTFKAINYTEGNTGSNNNNNISPRSRASSNGSLIDVMNNGLALQQQHGRTDRPSPSPGYQLFETFSTNNNSSITSNAYNLWKENSVDSKSHKSRSNNTSKRTKTKSSTGDEVQGKKSKELSPFEEILNSTHQQSSNNNKHQVSPDSQSQAQFRGQNNKNGLHRASELLDSASSSAIPNTSSITFPSILPSAFPFLPQIGRFPIHLPSFGLNSNHHQQQQQVPNNTNGNLSPISHSSFSPSLTINEKLTKEHHQRLISVYHQHQQSKTRPGFSPVESLIGPYSPYSGYQSAAAAALLLSQDLNRSSIPNVGIINPNSSNNISSSSQTSLSSHHNGISISTVPTGIPTPPSSTVNTMAGARNSMVTTTLLPPSLTALTLPAQNVCAKCNIGFRMTSDLVYHMRSHHKRETDPMKKKREDKLKCLVCFETFRERHHLTRHMTAHQDRAEEMMMDEEKP